ncbi:hypothetical protein [Janibacter corallicola]|uniref:hypothetical protein n=1 Tax=Janibacter corallicola TaxID=415212 RepID=UPI000B1E5FF1|nr:hypothetical protein [Janibacter corallicola]
MSDPETPEPKNPEEVLDAIEKAGPQGDLGRHYPNAEPVVDNAVANLLAMVQREEDGR